MHKKVFSFRKQFKIGNKGESLFIKHYSDMNARKTGTRDFDIFIDDNTKVELKSDSRSTLDSPNLFIERYSDLDKKTPGGVHQSFGKGTKYFVYLFLKDRTFFWYETSKLKDYIDKNEDKFEKKTIFNFGYRSLGYLVKREEVMKLQIRIDKF